MKLTDMNYNKKKAYQTLEEAMRAVIFTDMEKSNIVPVSLGIGRDEDGDLWFAIGSENEFTNCNYSDLKNWKEWFDKEWLEEEEV